MDCATQMAAAAATTSVTRIKEAMDLFFIALIEAYAGFKRRAAPDRPLQTVVRSLYSTEPVSRVATKVHHSNNNDFFGTDSVKDAVWKPMHKPSSDVKANHWPHIRMFRNVFDGALNLG